MIKLICPKAETENVLKQVRKDKTCDITISLLTDTDYARNNGWQPEIEGVDMAENNVIIVRNDSEVSEYKRK